MISTAHAKPLSRPSHKRGKEHGGTQGAASRRRTAGLGNTASQARTPYRAERGARADTGSGCRPQGPRPAERVGHPKLLLGGPPPSGGAREHRRRCRSRSRHRGWPPAGSAATGAQGLRGPEVAGSSGQPARASANRRRARRGQRSWGGRRGHRRHGPRRPRGRANVLWWE